MTKDVKTSKSNVLDSGNKTSSSSQLWQAEAVDRKRIESPPATKSSEPASLSTLSICRNKHWRFISSFHGPWLQLPQELLESFALGNYFSARPRIIDAGVFFDVVRIRRLVDEATNLSVRAVNGTGSSALGSSLNGGQGQRGGGGTTKLSGERRYRMRELAVKKLSEAYHLDEIAASVATMQSASSLEDVAKMVLLRAPGNMHARYVHFFHEKIPSRALAESTSLETLNEIIQGSPDSCAVLRTRAVTRIFKEDYTGAAKDLTDALTQFRRESPQHLTRQDSNRSEDEISKSIASPQDNRHNAHTLAEEAKPTGLEVHLYFQRAEVYLSSAYQSIEKALEYKVIPAGELQSDEGLAHGPSDALDAYRKVKLNAKRALRDFTAFLSRFEYSPGTKSLPSDTSAMPDNNGRTPEQTNNHIELGVSEEPIADAGNEESANATAAPEGSQARTVKIYQVSDLFSQTPPSNLPPFPATCTDLMKADVADSLKGDRSISPSERAEIVTYHPLLTEVLHGLLLCHALLQTDKSQIQHHAYTAARLVSLCDGFPVFIASRSASRADWVDVLNQTKSWLNLSMPWDELCKATTPNKQPRIRNQLDPRGSSHDQHQRKSTTSTKKALQETADIVERYVESGKQGPGSSSSSYSANNAQAKADLKAYALLTERADVIAKWILEAPVLPDAPAKSKKGKKKGARGSPLPG